MKLLFEVIFLRLNFILQKKPLEIVDKTRLFTITRRSERRRLPQEKLIGRGSHWYLHMKKNFLLATQKITFHKVLLITFTGWLGYALRW